MIPHRALSTWKTGLLVILIANAGCRATSAVRETDSKIRQHAAAGETAYAEGDVEVAMGRYRKALKRAWALDDPLESANASHNLAACLVSLGELDPALAWVREARLEFERARVQDPNNMLLEAKIARQMGALDDAWRLAAEAEQLVACCPAKPAICPPAPTKCECECVQRYQFRKYREQQNVLRRKSNTVQAEVHLIRALLACDQGDAGQARNEICLACELLPDVCEPELHAELQHVFGLIHRLEGRPDLAARHFDLEAELLRNAGNYREIPRVLLLAAADYEQVGLTALAADRSYRVARIHFARGHLELASEQLKRGLLLAESSDDPVVQDRFALLFKELSDAVEAVEAENAKSKPDPPPPESNRPPTAEP